MNISFRLAYLALSVALAIVSLAGCALGSGGADKGGVDTDEGSIDERACEPMDVRVGRGDCEEEVGIWFRGGDPHDSCVSETGCGCIGEDCDKLFMTREDCIEAHSHCKDLH